MKKMQFTHLAYFAAAVALTVNAANAAPISWSAAGINGLGDSAVSTDGGLVYAYNFGDSADVTVNTVAFTGTATGSVADAAGEGNITVTNPDNGANANFGNQGPDIETLMDSASWAHRNPDGSGLPDSGGTGVRTTINLNNLTAGQDYLVQVFSSDTRGSRNSFVAIDRELPGAFISPIGNGAVSAGGGDGIVLTGLFNADATSQSFTYIHDGLGGNANYAAIQVRSVPEPASLALLAFGSLTIFVGRRNA